MSGTPGRPGSALAPYRVIDMSEGGFNWCGKALADLGADVIKVEPPGGSPTRRRGPFVNDEPGPENSLFWWSFCSNKRGVVIDVESEGGRERLRGLIEGADVLVESFQPGYLDGLGLGYEALSRTHPGLVYTSITPYGQTGPYAQYKASDLTASAMGGLSYLCGDQSRPPVRISAPQCEFLAGAQGAAGTMTALWERARSGIGQQVDVSMQVAVAWSLMNANAHPALVNENVYRGGAVRAYGNLTTRWVYSCKDGTLSALALGGTVSAGSMHALVAWMDEEGYATKEMVERDWATQDLQQLIMAGPDDPAVVEFLDVQERVQRFFSTKTKQELFDRAIRDSIMLAPCQTVQDIRESPQLAAREYWHSMAPAVGRDALDFPGPYIKLSETPIEVVRRAPSVGEHNDEVFGAVDDGPKANGGAETPVGRSKANGDAALPFARLRVLDMSWVGVGPITMKYLADHGAEVIRVESVSRPDPARSVPPYKDGKPGFNRSQFPANFNTGKYGLGLNMTKPEARELIKRIITTWRPDVLAESFTPRAMRGWGLDYANVRKLKDDIIYYSTCQQGQTGPHASYGGYGNLAAALAGFYHVTGWPDLEPAGVYGAYTDFVNPPNGVAAVIAALDHRRRTGQGQHLDLSQYECAVHYLAPALLDYQLTGRVADRDGNRDPQYAPHNVYACAPEPKDRLNPHGESWCAIAVTNDEEWAGLRRAMGSPAWAADGRFDSMAGRKAHEAELDREIGAWTAGLTQYDVMKRLQAEGVPAGVVQKASDLWDDPQLKEQGYFTWLEHNECGPMPYDRVQFSLSRTPGRLAWAAPTVGQHNEHVLREMIGLSEDDVGELIASEVLETSW